MEKDIFNIPKIRFRYSWIYDEGYRNSQIIREKLKKQGLNYPPVEEVRDYINKIEPEWKKVEVRVLREMSKITSLKWKEKEIICYVIGYGRSFSDPLTIKMHKTDDLFIDTLVHEMIHQIQIQNREKNKSWKDYVDKIYKEESILTKNHIFVHAVHKKIYLTLFNQKRLDEEIEDSQISIDYKKSWQIVEKEGYENIIKKFKEITK